MLLKIDAGIGWKADPKKPGHLVSADIADYVTEIERLRAIIANVALAIGHNDSPLVLE